MDTSMGLIYSTYDVCYVTMLGSNLRAHIDSRDGLYAPWRDFSENFTLRFLLLNKGVYLSI